jgi:protein SCO1/2
MKKILIAVAITAFFSAGLWLGMVQQREQQLEILMQDQVVTVLKTPRPLAVFTLQDQDQAKFDLSQLQGKWSLLFFGFTNCPDICPTTLSTLNQLHGELGKQKNGTDDVQFIFISVDPGRDSSDKLKRYVKYFNEAFLGVTGDKKEIARLAGQLGAHYEVLDKSGEKNYGVNHTAAIFIIDKKGRYFGLMSPPLDPAAMASRIELIKQL